MGGLLGCMVGVEEGWMTGGTGGMVIANRKKHLNDDFDIANRTWPMGTC